MSRRARDAALGAALLLVACGPARAGETFVVDSFDDLPDVFPGSGICFTTAGTCTLRAAVQEANAAPGLDTIVLGAGEYTLDVRGAGEDAAATGDLDVTDDLTIEGAGIRDSTLLAGTGDRAFEVDEGVFFTLADLSVEGGVTVADGGAIRAREDALVLAARVQFRGGIAVEAGGAISLVGSGAGGATLLAYESEFILNVAGIPSDPRGERGGAIHASGLSDVQLVDCSLSSNEADTAPALWTDFGSVTIDRTTIAHHVSDGATIAVSTSGRTVRITNSTIRDNRSNVAILASYQDGPVRLQNATIVDNRAPITVASLSLFGDVDLRNTVLFNTASQSECAGADSLGHNATPPGPEGYCAPLDPTDLVIDDPLLQLVAYEEGKPFVYVPLASSPLIDAGDDASCPALDQRGRPRPEDGDGDGVAHCDIGAVEVPEAGCGADGVAALLAIAWCVRRRGARSPTHRGTPSCRVSSR